MNFLDSNILAYAFYQNKFQDNCQGIIRKGGVIDTINLVEAFNIIESETNRDTAITSLRALLKSNIKIIDVDINIIFETLKRLEKYKKLKFLDLLHYMVALLNNCKTIISYDLDFNNLEIPRKEGIA